MIARYIPLLAWVSLISVFAQAAPIANWKEMNPGIAPFTSGLNTDGPTFGDGSAANAQSAFIAGRFGTVAAPATVTLAQGETLVVSGNLVLTGGGAHRLLAEHARISATAT